MTLSSTRLPISEPFVKACYFGPQRCQSRNYRSHKIEWDARYEDVVKAILDEVTIGNGNEVIFFKDMAYYIQGRYNILEEYFSDAEHSFLIRDPKKAIPSYYQMSQNPETRSCGWVQFDPKEVGYRELYEMYEFVKEKLDPKPVVVDADDLLESPKQIMKAYCDGVGIKYEDHMTSWKAGEVLPQAWKSRSFSLTWRHDAINSSGFVKTRSDPDGMMTYPSDVITAVEESQPFYKKLYSARIKLI